MHKYAWMYTQTLAPGPQIDLMPFPNYLYIFTLCLLNLRFRQQQVIDFWVYVCVCES